MRSSGVIFDGDDTLWGTGHLYEVAKEEFFDEMAKLGYDRAEVEKTFERTDVGNVARLGFSRQRFPTSMADTYRLFCKQNKRVVEESIESRVKAIGYAVFTKRPSLLDRARDVLAQLRSSHMLVLATKGDRDIQRERIADSGLSSYFAATYILDQKTEREWQRIVRECDLNVAHSWAVGNSLKSDINPALQVGLSAIWVPYRGWGYEDDVRPDSSRFYEVTSLADILGIIKGD